MAILFTLALVICLVAGERYDEVKCAIHEKLLENEMR